MRKVRVLCSVLLFAISSACKKYWILSWRTVLHNISTILRMKLRFVYLKHFQRKWRHFRISFQLLFSGFLDQGFMPHNHLLHFNFCSVKPFLLYTNFVAKNWGGIHNPLKHYMLLIHIRKAAMYMLLCTFDELTWTQIDGLLAWLLMLSE